MKRKVKIKVLYFKPSGKLVYSGEFEDEFTYLGEYPKGTLYMTEVVDYMKRWLDGDFDKPLPGLISQQWHGPALIDSDDGFPHLILP